jgi:hypothetical protein
VRAVFAIALMPAVALALFACGGGSTRHVSYVIHREGGVDVISDAGTIATCGDGGCAPLDASVPPPPVVVPDPSYPTPHAPIPLLRYHQGQILDAPRLVTVTYDGDPFRDFLEGFGDTITTTPWWDAVSAGYCDFRGACVGHGTSGGHVHLAALPPPHFDDAPGTQTSSLKQYIDANIQSGLFPPPDTSTIYLLYFLDGTSVSLDGKESCTGFGAYHNGMTTTPPGSSSPVTFAFAVVPRCMDGQNVVTLSASHELIEAASDPVYDTVLQSYAAMA